METNNYETPTPQEVHDIIKSKIHLFRRNTPYITNSNYTKRFKLLTNEPMMGNIVIEPNEGGICTVESQSKNHHQINIYFIDIYVKDQFVKIIDEYSKKFHLLSKVGVAMYGPNENDEYLVQLQDRSSLLIKIRWLEFACQCRGTRMIGCPDGYSTCGCTKGEPCLI